MAEAGLIHRNDLSFTENESEAIVTVADTGIGIPHEEAAASLDRFFRPAGPDADAHSGPGLCILTLAAEAHDGAVQLENESGRGSIFIVRLPRPEE